MYELMAAKHPFRKKNRQDMFEGICSKPAKMLESFSLPAQLMLMGLLTIDPKCRLGTSELDAQEIKNQPFFADVDWDRLVAKEYIPPHKPEVEDKDDFRHIQPVKTKGFERILEESDYNTGESEDFKHFDFKL